MCSILRVCEFRWAIIQYIALHDANIIAMATCCLTAFNNHKRVIIYTKQGSELSFLNECILLLLTASMSSCNI